MAIIIRLTFWLAPFIWFFKRTYKIMLKEIFESIERKELIPLEKLEIWSNNNDIEIMAGAFYVLTNHYYLIEPKPKLDDYFKFFLKYIDRCIKENYDINAYRYIDSRYTAAHYLNSWFIFSWKSKELSLNKKLEIKNMIEKLYKEGDEDIKICVITGILEHLFLENKIKKFFRDWLDDPDLKPAYEEALGYSNVLRKKSREF